MRSAVWSGVLAVSLLSVPVGSAVAQDPPFERIQLKMLQMFAELFQPVGAEASDMALDAIADVGYGGHFFGCAHTQARFRSAFFAPMISDWRNYESWREAGSPTAYDTAKGAVEMMVKTLAVALAPHNIRVNGIAPGLVLTPRTMWAIERPQDGAWIRLHTPNGQIPPADALGGAAVYLASDSAYHTTGHMLAVDGGMSAWQNSRKRFLGFLKEMPMTGTAGSRTSRKPKR